MNARSAHRGRNIVRLAPDRLEARTLLSADVTPLPLALTLDPRSAAGNPAHDVAQHGIVRMSGQTLPNHMVGVTVIGGSEHHVRSDRAGHFRMAMRLHPG